MGAIKLAQNIPVEEDAAEGLLEVLLHARHGLLEDIKVRRLRITVGALRDQIVVDDLVDGVRVRKGDQLVVLRHVLPVVDKDGLDVIRDWKFDRGAGVKAIFLLSVLEPVT